MPTITHAQILELQAASQSVHVSDALLDYTQALVRFTRESPELELGLSPRGAVDLIGAARSWALIHGHKGVHPEDIKAVFPSVAVHRLQHRNERDCPHPDIAAFVLESVPVP